MKYIKITKLEHGIVIHYQSRCGNIESHFIEDDASGKARQSECGEKKKGQD